MPGCSLSMVVGMPLTVMMVVSTTCSRNPVSPSSSRIDTTPAATSNVADVARYIGYRSGGNSYGL